MTKISLTILFVILMNFALLPDADSIVSYWSFAKDSGIVLKDISGNGNNGQVIGSPRWVNGRLGKSIEFDGLDDFIIIQDNKSYNFSKDDSFSISLWINYRPGIDWQGIIQKFDGKFCSIDIGTQADNKLYFAISDGTNYSKAVAGDVSGKWHHCCFVRDTKPDKLLFNMGQEFQSDLDKSTVSQSLQQGFQNAGVQLSQSAVISVKEAGNEWQITNNQQIYNIRKEGDRLNIYTDKIYIYLDGKLAVESEDITSSDITNKADLYIGARKPGNTYMYKGMIDELAIYKQVLTEAEIKQAVKGNLPEVYHESNLRRFEIISTVSLPFTALHSYLVVRGVEMLRQKKVAPKFKQANWNTMGGLTVLFSGFIGFWDWLHVRGEDISEMYIPGENIRGSTYDYNTRYSSRYLEPGIVFLSMGF